MTSRTINSYQNKKGNACEICTGCGKCSGQRKFDAVSDFSFSEAESLAYKMGEFADYTDCMVAVDIGTTTVVMQKRRLHDGKIEGEYHAVNPQRIYGADVLSRIDEGENPESRKHMQELILQCLEDGLSALTENTKIRFLAIAGNTTMLHLLRGYEVAPLGRYPFEAVTLQPERIEIFGMPAVLLPGSSAFVGADITADVLALSMDKGEELRLLVDLGTNGEMVLGNKGRLMGTATAAGPAFEGGTKEYGADILSAVAELLKQGILDETGLLEDPYFSEGIVVGNIGLTQRDIRQLQMAKAAISAGIRILCNQYGVGPAAVKEVYLAGGMGCYLNADAAIQIGLLPECFAGKVKSVGNAVLQGAFLYGRKWYLIKQGMPSVKTPDDSEITEGFPGAPKISCFNLADMDEFEKIYLNSMGLTQ